MNKENKKYIEGFEEYLKNKNLSAKTIRRHVSNAEFYINDYLADHYEDVDAIKGIDDFYIGDFFDYFFIRKCMWSTPYTMKEYAASLKKFYTYLNEEELISDEQLQDLKDTFKYSLEDWCDDCEIYNNGDEYIQL